MGLDFYDVLCEKRVRVFASVCIFAVRMGMRDVSTHLIDVRAIAV